MNPGAEVGPDGGREGAQARRPCDLILRGGITSGVVYPGLIAELSKGWRFHSIGGASAGAIGAGIAAAAEHGVLSGRRPDAFETVVARIPEQIGGQARADGGTDFRALFRATPGLEPLADLLWQWMEAPAERRGGVLERAGARAVWGVLGGPVLRGGLVAFLVVETLAMLLLWRAGWPGGAMVAGLTLVAALGAGLGGGLWAGWRARPSLWAEARALEERLGAAGFGLAGGVNPGLGETPARADMLRHGGFADWMHGVIEEAAGRGEEEGPLTVGDLWGTNDPAAPRAIDLMVTTTNLSQQLAHQFPFLERSSSFLYFREEELRAVLPAAVVRHMVARSERRWRIVVGPGEAEPQGTYWRLPRPWDLPVVLGVRMSLSFPGLIGAVRLWECPAFSRMRGRLRPCWFSDGGITSNFPVTSFDAPLPSRPTFCVNLTDLPDGGGERVTMVRSNSEGVRAPHLWDASRPRLAGFAGAIVAAARNAQENELQTMPSQRDRIVSVRLKPDEEGGLNLGMPAETIARLSGYGATAAGMLDQRFGPSPRRGAMGWDNHRWIRLRTALAGMERLTIRFAEGFDRADADGVSAGAVLADSCPARGPRRSYGWGTEAAFERARAEAARLAEAGERLERLVPDRPRGSVFDGTAKPGGSQRVAGAPRPAMGFQLRPTGSLDPRKG